MGTGWQWRVREAARTGRGQWYFSRLDGPRATWIIPATLTEQARVLPPNVFARLWENVWTSDAGDLLPTRQIEESLVLPGPETEADGQSLYVAGIDASLTSDATGLVVLGVRPGSGKVRLAVAKTWLPRGGRQVDYIEVERVLLELHQRFAIRQVRFDPMLLAGSFAQRMELAGLRLLSVPFNPTAQDILVRQLWRAFAENHVQLYDDPPLLRDLRSLTVVERGLDKLALRLERDAFGHKDTGVAFLLALSAALPIALRFVPVAGSPDTGRVIIREPLPAVLCRPSVPRHADGSPNFVAIAARLQGIG
jgi:hypothetical protein